MVAVQLSGGLGNQMFEYALYLKLKSLGKEVKIDDFTCYGEGKRALQLSVFGVQSREDIQSAFSMPAMENASGEAAPAEVDAAGMSMRTATGNALGGNVPTGADAAAKEMLLYDRLTRKEYIALTDSDLRLHHKIRRKLTGRKDLSYREYSVNFDAKVLRQEPALLLGCFQTERYFADIKEQVRETYRFRNLALSEQMRAYERQIGDCQSVSVHIRRGDYLDPKYSALYTGICDDSYYERAIGRMRALVPGARFFFFSNDAEWVKAHYAGPDFVTVEGNGEDSGFTDMYLMSKCRHNIIANSSFSWWGAWLNDNPKKQVIAPKRWLNRVEADEAYAREECRDIYTEDMLVL